MRGIPGSGKSTIAQELKNALGSETVCLIDPDEIDLQSESYLALSKSLIDQGVDKKFHPYRFLRAQAHQAILNHKIILWNQAFTSLDGFEKTIINLENYAQEHNLSLPVLVTEVEIDKNAAKKRINDRVDSGGHNVPTKEFDRFVSDYKSFGDHYQNLLRLDGNKSPKTNSELLIKKISSL